MRKNSLKVAARLAAATALTGSLAACDGGLRSLTSSSETAVQTAVVPPAEPGNPVYLEGSRAESYVAYEQAYGAPVEGSGQTYDTGYVNVGSAPAVFQDQVIEQAAIPAPMTELNTDYIMPQSDLAAVETTYNTVEVAPYSLPVDQGEYSVLIEEDYSTPIAAFPVLDGSYETMEAPLPMSQGIFADASYEMAAVQSVEDGIPMVDLFDPISVETAYALEPAQDFEPTQEFASLLDQPYGSTASHRYSASELSSENTYSVISEQSLMVEEPEIASETVESPLIQVAFLADGYAPMPRMRPAEPAVYQTATVSPSKPIHRPEMIQAVLRTPMPVMRPVSHSTQTTTIAAAPMPMPTPEPQPSMVSKVIEVEQASVEPEPKIESGPEVASLTPAPVSVPAVMEPKETETESTISVTPVVTAPAPTPAPEPKEEVEVAALVTRTDALMEEDLVELSGTSWRLTSLDGEALSDTTAELHFDGRSGFAGGQAFCNNYGGEFKEKLDGTFDMGSIFATEKECPHLALEKKYISALKEANGYRIDPREKKLMLIGANGEPVMTFLEF